MKKIKYILVIIICFLANIKITSATQSVITDGTYIIKSAVDTNKVIDLYNNSTKDETNVQLFKNNNGDNQKWIFTLQKDGYYQIASKLDKNKVLDVFRNIQADYTNVELYKSNNGDNQKWNLKYIGNNYFNITSKNGKYCLDVNGGNSANETNIQIYKCINSTAQKFKLTPIIEGKQTIEDGTYIIKSALDEKKLLDINHGNTTNGTNIEIFNNNGGNNQKWKIKYLNDGYYQIITKLNDNKCLDVNNANFIPETNVQLYDCNNSLAQKWIIKDLGNGYYNLITAGDHMYLDIYRELTTNGNNVQIYYGNNNKGQKFKFTKIADQDIEKKTLNTGSYTIKTYLNNKKSLDIYTGNVEENASVKLFSSSNNNNQKWYITKLNDGYYTIKSLSDSSLYLSTNNSSSKLTKEENRWEIINIKDNLYNIKQKNSNNYLSIENSKTSDGTNIVLSTTNNKDGQKFYIEETSLNNNDRTIPDGYYTINSKLDNNKVLDIFNNSKTNFTNVELYSKNNGNNQIWYFKYLYNGYYSITTALNSKLALNNSENNIDIYKLNNSSTQQWKLTDDKNGYISITNKSNNKCIDIYNNQTSDKTNIESFSCHYQNNQKFKLVKNITKKPYKGIDISSYQGNINWEKLSNSNIGFIIIKLGSGDNWPSQDDKKFEEYVDNCEKYNIPYAVYLYSYAKNVTGDTYFYANSESATSEAEHTLRKLKDISNKGYYPALKTSVYLDIEDDSVSIYDKNRLTEISDKYCSIITSNGYKCGIYANNYWLTNKLNATTIAQKYNIWLAEWNVKLNHNSVLSSKPNYKLTNYKIWQFSDNGHINGISGNVDLDVAYDIFD